MQNMINHEGREKYTDLWLIRHCQSTQQHTGLLQQKDINLSPLGLRQANGLAAYLSSISKFAALYSSPLQRAMETASRIAESLNLETTIVNELREIDFGCAGGLSIDEFRQKWPDLSSLWEDPYNLDFQWPGGESRKEFHRRSLDAINTLVQAHRGDSILIIAHTGNLCGYLAQLFLENPLRWREFPLQPASISRVKLDLDEAHLYLLNEARLFLLDDVSHLQNLE
jgi:broad specificity phosphatase PhoE